MAKSVPGSNSAQQFLPKWEESNCFKYLLFTQNNFVKEQKRGRDTEIASIVVNCGGGEENADKIPEALGPEELLQPETQTLGNALGSFLWIPKYVYWSTGID